MEFVVFPAVVLYQEHFDATPRTLDCVGVCPCFRIDELDVVVDSEMRVTMSTEIVVWSQRIADDRSAGFDLVTYYGHQCVGGSVRHWNKECFVRPSFNTTEHPLTQGVPYDISADRICSHQSRQPCYDHQA